MPKTGGSHIIYLLSTLTDGDLVGAKHSSATSDIIKSDRLIASSIRNPWDWYLSLWTYGTQGQGALMKRLTLTGSKRFSRLLKKGIKKPKAYNELFSALLYRRSAEIKEWRNLYSNKDVQSFRIWLKRIHDPENSHRLKEGYKSSAISNHVGFMTYRYLKLCCENLHQLNDSRSVNAYGDIKSFEKKNCYIDYFIRQEKLEHGVTEFVQNCHDCMLTEKQIDVVNNSDFTNISEREHEISNYYNQETIELIYEKERLIIDKFGYSSPVDSTSTIVRHKAS